MDFQPCEKQFKAPLEIDAFEFISYLNLWHILSFLSLKNAFYISKSLVNRSLSDERQSIQAKSLHMCFAFCCGNFQSRFKHSVAWYKTMLSRRLCSGYLRFDRRNPSRHNPFTANSDSDSNNNNKKTTKSLSISNNSRKQKSRAINNFQWTRIWRDNTDNGARIQWNWL